MNRRHVYINIDKALLENLTISRCENGEGYDRPSSFPRLPTRLPLGDGRVVQNMHWMHPCNMIMTVCRVPLHSKRDSQLRQVRFLGVTCRELITTREYIVNAKGRSQSTHFTEKNMQSKNFIR